MKKHYLLSFFFILFFCLIRAQNFDLSIKSKDSLLLEHKNISISKIYKIKDSISSLFIKKGYYQIVIDSSLIDQEKRYNFTSTKKWDFIYITKPNNQKVVDFIERFVHNKFIDNKIQIKYEAVPEVLQYLTVSFNDLGYPFASFSLKNILFSKELLSADLFYDLKKSRIISNIKILGYNKFPKKYVKRLQVYFANKQYSNRTLFDLSDYVHRLGFVEEIKFPEVLFKKDSTIVYMYLKKGKRNSFDGLIGLSNDSLKSTIQLDGFLKVKLFNVFDRGNQYNLSWIKGNDFSKLNIDVDIPFVYGSAVSSGFNFNINRREKYLNTIFKTNILYDFKTNKSVFFRFKTLRSFVLDEGNSNLSNLSNKFIGFGVRYRIKQNSLINPYFTNIELGYNLGIRQAEEVTISQKELVIQLNNNIKLYKNSFFETVIQYKELYSDSYLENELYIIGEGLTYRSLKNSQIKATKLFFLKNDLKLYSKDTSFVGVIADYGIFYDKRNSTEIQTLSLGIGVGLKISKTGLLNLNFMVNKENDFGFRNGLLGVQLLSVF